MGPSNFRVVRSRFVDRRPQGAPGRSPDVTDADRAVLSYPADLSTWGRRQLETPWFRAYLRKTMGERRDGDDWEEFLDVGCCGNTLDVSLHLERLEGGDEIGPDTEIAYEERGPEDVAGGWRVQSAGGPTRSGR